MELNRSERWIISNQLKILGIIDPIQKDYYDRTKKIIDDGYELLYGSSIQYIVPDDQTLSENECKHTIDILNMFLGITRSLDKIEDKTGIEGIWLEFSGFDGNEEGPYFSFARFYCTEYSDGVYASIGEGLDNFNSHGNRLEKYGRMLEVWNTCRDKYSLTREELIQIENA